MYTLPHFLIPPPFPYSCHPPFPSQNLFNHWWRERQGGGCGEGVDGRRRKSSAVSASHTHALGLTNVGGVFLVLVAGLAVAFVVAVVEFIWKARTDWDLTELGR